MPAPGKTPRWFACIDCDNAICSDALGCVEWPNPVSLDPTQGLGVCGVGGAMHVYHEITFYVDEVKVTTDWPKLSVKDILELAGKSGFRLKCMDTGTEFSGFHLEIMPRQGSRYITPNGPCHSYDLEKARQAWGQGEKL
jgi:hypothetical protein